MTENSVSMNMKEYPPALHQGRYRKLYKFTVYYFAFDIFILNADEMIL